MVLRRVFRKMNAEEDVVIFIKDWLMNRCKVLVIAIMVVSHIDASKDAGIHVSIDVSIDVSFNASSEVSKRGLYQFVSEDRKRY